jgi:hypothetical protein
MDAKVTWLKTESLTIKIHTRDYVRVMSYSGAFA